MIKALVPKPLRPKIRNACNRIPNKLLLIRLFGRDASMIPPLELMRDGAVDFEDQNKRRRIPSVLQGSLQSQTSRKDA